MKLGLNRLRQRYGRMPLIYPTHALALDFDSAVYETGGVRYAAVSSIPGYAYTRSGAKGEQNASLAVEQFAANVPGIPTGVGYRSRPAATNLLLNAGQAATLATQTVNLPASAHTLSFIGTGEVVISGTGTGTLTGTGANNRVSLTFTPTAGDVIFTVTGSVTYAGLIVGTVAGPIISTAGTTAATGADIMSLTDSMPALTDQDMLIFARFTNDAAGTSGIVQFDAGTSDNRIALWINGTALIQRVDTAGVNQYNGGGVTIVLGEPTTTVLRRLAGAWRGAKIVAGVLTWTDAGAAGTMPIGIDTIRPGEVNVGGGNALNGVIPAIAIRNGTFTTDADVIAAAGGI